MSSTAIHFYRYQHTLKPNQALARTSPIMLALYWWSPDASTSPHCIESHKMPEEAILRKKRDMTGREKCPPVPAKTLTIVVDWYAEMEHRTPPTRPRSSYRTIWAASSVYEALRVPASSASTLQHIWLAVSVVFWHPCEGASIEGFPRMTAALHSTQNARQRASRRSKVGLQLR